MPGDRRQRRRDLFRLASTQSGYFTAAEGLKLGYTYQAQKYHVDAGNWQRVDRGLFRLPEIPVGEFEDLVRWFLWSGRRGVISHETALAVHELGDVNPRKIHMTVPGAFRKQGPEHLVLHRANMPDRDVRGHDGFLITSPLRSIFDIAPLATQHVVDRAVDDALRRGIVSRRQLLRRTAEVPAQAALSVERALHKIDRR